MLFVGYTTTCAISALHCAPDCEMNVEDAGVSRSDPCTIDNLQRFDGGEKFWAGLDLCIPLDMPSCDTVTLVIVAAVSWQRRAELAIWSVI